MGANRYTLDDLEGSYSPREFAELTHLSLRTVQRLIAEGRLDAVRVSPRKYRIPKRAADAHLAGGAAVRFPVAATA